MVRFDQGLPCHVCLSVQYILIPLSFSLVHILVWPEEMQSLSVLCAQPLGLENAGDMSAGDLRSSALRMNTLHNCCGSTNHSPRVSTCIFLQ